MVQAGRTPHQSEAMSLDRNKKRREKAQKVQADPGHLINKAHDRAGPTKCPRIELK